jgi:hypothetical protein
MAFKIALRGRSETWYEVTTVKEEKLDETIVSSGQ